MKKREDLLKGILQIEQPEAAKGPRVNVDTILLANFANPSKGERILEIGCAHGAITLILAKRGFSVEGIDIQKHLIDMAMENAIHNKLDDKTKFICNDIKNYKALWTAQSFDRIVVNPPYYKEHSVRSSPYIEKTVAKQEAECTLEEIIIASKYLLKNKGSLNIIISASRLSELVSLLAKYNIEPKVMRAVHSKEGSPASVVLIEAVRAAKIGLKILSPLFMRGPDDKETEELLSAYTLKESETSCP